MMAQRKTFSLMSDDERRRRLLYGVLAFWGLVALCIGGIFLFIFGMGEHPDKMYLLPWCLATGAVITAPSVYLIYKRKFNPFHPLVFPAWGYFFPGFCVGGLIVAAGLSSPYILSLIPDENYNLPLTLVYVMIGYAGLTLGFCIPYARRFGNLISRRLPQWEISNDRIAFASLVLLVLGVANTALAFELGILGFQRVEEVGTFDGIIYLFSLFFLAAIFLLWLYVFRSDRIGLRHRILIVLLIGLSLLRSAFQGNRGSLGQFIILIAFAYTYSGGQLKVKQYAVGSGLMVMGLLIGMIYGTTFRSIKESENAVSIGQYISFVSRTFDSLGEQNVGVSISTGLNALAERVDALSPTAVVVSNYESLAPYEEAWGINNNIYVDTMIFFIPRAIWPNKPVAMDPSKYGDLYFNYGENSFTITPMGDLLRNFGPIGVPIGMIVLGMIIRVMYAALIEGQQFDYWKVTLFYMIFTNAISFEDTYSLIVPLIFKVGLVTIFGLVLVRLFSRSRSTAT